MGNNSAQFLPFLYMTGIANVALFLLVLPKFLYFFIKRPKQIDLKIVSADKVHIPACVLPWSTCSRNVCTGNEIKATLTLTLTLT